MIYIFPERLVALLRQQAAEIAEAGYGDWSNTMLDAADTLESMDEDLDACREAHFGP